MAKKKVSRKALLKEPDEFLTFSARAAIFISEHSRQFTYAAYVLVAAILIFVGINTYLKYVNRKGQEAYNTAYLSLMKTMNPASKPEDWKKSGELLQKVIDDHGLSKVSRLVPPELAFLKFKEKKYNETLALYQRFLEETEADSPYHLLTQFAMAACLEEKGEFEKAIETLNNIINSPSDFLKEQAMLSQARVYRLSKKEDKSLQILKEFIDTYKTSPFLPIAKALLNKS